MTLREAIYQAAIGQLLEDRGPREAPLVYDAPVLQFSGDRARDRVIPLATPEVSASLINSDSRERQRSIAR